MNKTYGILVVIAILLAGILATLALGSDSVATVSDRAKYEVQGTVTEAREEIAEKAVETLPAGAGQAVAAKVTGEAPAAAITAADAERIVLEKYPDARIHFTKEDYDDGRLIYEVKFSTGQYVDSEIEIDATTGAVIKVDLDR